MNKLTSLLLCALCSLSGINVLSQDSIIQSSLDSICQKSNYPGVVFTYIDASGGVHAFASGLADKEKNVRMTPEHKLHGGSTGKTIVSAVIMQLVTEGKLNFDDKVSTYLSSYAWFPRLANADQLTIRQLLQHSSGIIRYEFKEAFLNELKKNPKKVWQPEELIAFVLDDTPPFAAGEGFTYSDTNYILLGMIIEKVTGNDFYDEAARRVLTPQKLNTITPTRINPIQNMAQGYYTEGTEYALGFKAPFLIDGIAQNNMQFEWTGGGYAYANADYARLLKKLYEGEVFDMAALKDDFFGYVDALEIRGKYGLGVIRYEFPNVGELIGHSGFFPGYNTAGFYHTASKKVFTMQINCTEMPQLQRFFGDYLKLVSEILALEEK